LEKPFPYTKGPAKSKETSSIKHTLPSKPVQHQGTHTSNQHHPERETMNSMEHLSNVIPERLA